MNELNKEAINKAQGAQPWDIGNQVLYDFCAKYPLHDNENAIIGKVWLIGRSYAAAIERHKIKDLPNNEQGDGFYFNRVGPQMVGANFDKMLESLKGETKPTKENAAKILAVHEALTQTFGAISGQRKISLASKYLHFHFPDLFFIYDSRANTGISKLVQGSIKTSELLNSKTDAIYCRFFMRCLKLRDEIEGKFDKVLTPREVDNLLLG